MWWSDKATVYESAAIQPDQATARDPAAIQPDRATVYDAAAIRLKIAKLAVTRARTEEQCSGVFIVRNIGPGYQVPPHIVGPSYGIFIYDEQGTMLFRRFGGWSGLKAGQECKFKWVTNSNHLGETTEPAFFIPRPGRYKLEVLLYRGRRSDILTTATHSFDVK